MHHVRTAALSAALILFGVTAETAAPHCYTSYGGVKPNKLYLYFPTASDPTYPEFGTPNGAPATQPAHAFDVTDLTSYTGTAADLRNAVYDVVADDYCEFNVEVIATTTAPPATFPRRNTVSIGTDDGTSAGGLFGLAQNVDTGDATLVDFAHEWAATYQGLYGGPGGALNGANSTLDRWARSIGGTAAHEAGHNYGLSHTDGLSLQPGEDPLTHHVMASGSHFSGEERAGYRRHFSDHEYSVLASNVGLSVQTVWNWDFVNPNAQTATKVRMDILSTQAPLSVSGPYNGNESPWVNPTVSASLGSQVFQGVTYNRFQVTWSAGHAWDGHVPGGPGPSPGTSGQVAGAASFHIGTGFSGVNYNLPNPIIITDVTLFDASNTALALDAADGTFNVKAFNVAGPPLELVSMRVQFLPRLLSIDAMVPGHERLMDVRDQPFSAWGEAKTIQLGRSLRKGQAVTIPIARLSDKRHVVERITAEDCARDDRLKGRDVGSCKPGINVDLFPATTTFLTATIVDPSAKHWDAKAEQYVTGPVTSHVFLQFLGRHPDLNKNGQDDYIDILTGRSKDANRDGVPDKIQKH